MQIKIRGGIFETNSSSTHAYLEYQDPLILFPEASVVLYSKEEIQKDLEIVLEHNFPFTSKNGLKLTGFYYPGTSKCLHEVCDKRCTSKSLEELESNIQGFADGTSWVLRLQYIMLGIWYTGMHPYAADLADLNISSPANRFPRGTHSILTAIINRAITPHSGIVISDTLIHPERYFFNRSFNCWRNGNQTSGGLEDELNDISRTVYGLITQSEDVLVRLIFGKDVASVDILD